MNRIMITRIASHACSLWCFRVHWAGDRGKKLPHVLGIGAGNFCSIGLRLGEREGGCFCFLVVAFIA